MNDEQVSLGTAVCTHIPSDPFHHVGQVTPCKLCGQHLCYSNPPAGTHPRMSKKERRKIKAQQRNHAMALTEKKIVEESIVRR